MSFRKRLAGLQENWDNAGQRKGGYENLPDGRYIAALSKAYIRESEKGDLYVVLHFVVEEGDHDGSIVYDWNRIETEDGLYYTRQKLLKMGADVPDKLAKLEDCLSDLQDGEPRVRLQLKTKGDFQNVYLDRLLDSDDEPYEPEDAPWDGDGDDKGDDAGDAADTGEEPDDADDDADDSDDTGSDDATPEVDLAVGMRVDVEGRGEGMIKKIDEENELVHVRLDTGKRAVVEPDAIMIIDDADNS